MLNWAEIHCFCIMNIQKWFTFQLYIWLYILLTACLEMLHWFYSLKKKRLWGPVSATSKNITSVIQFCFLFNTGLRLLFFFFILEEYKPTSSHQISFYNPCETDWIHEAKIHFYREITVFLFFVFKEVATLKLKYMIQNILAPSS